MAAIPTLNGIANVHTPLRIQPKVVNGDEKDR